ncbi:hypothetical protein CFAM422_007271 [Trichoderma lentiforme]|uniref:Uncharacterized protein n=1 Tax=Trichoderma lentiforme TaxID=1567552 RepID=A0A9P5CDE5_9HYPO|nr:hypothetical protein CFAM422_007271 [Trichoderma lentiforme]
MERFSTRQWTARFPPGHKLAAADIAHACCSRDKSNGPLYLAYGCSLSVVQATWDLDIQGRVVVTKPADWNRRFHSRDQGLDWIIKKKMQFFGSQKQAVHIPIIPIHGGRVGK